jgi:hypothetical protein
MDETKKIEKPSNEISDSDNNSSTNTTKPTRSRRPAAKKADTVSAPTNVLEAVPDAAPESISSQPEVVVKTDNKVSTPNPQAAAEIEAISHDPVAMKVAYAPHGSQENSDYAALPDSYPYRTRIRRADYEAQKEKLQIELLKGTKLGS